MMGLIAACISVFSYAGYIIGIRKTRAVEVNSTVLTCYVMGLGALFFLWMWRVPWEMRPYRMH